MTARRAVLLTLLVVFALLVILAGGFLGYREYTDVRDRAERAEEALAAERNRPPDTTKYADGLRFGANTVYSSFVEGVLDGGGAEFGKAEPGWYAVYVVPNGNKGWCCAVENSLRMQSCHDYWWTPGDPKTIWRSNDLSDDADC